MEDGDLPRIGDPIQHPPPPVFELFISEHVSTIDPREFGVDRDGINPVDYFVTSGDAVEKAKILDRDLWQLAGALRREAYALIAADHKCDLIQAQDLFRQGIRPQNPARFGELEAATWKAAGQSRKLLSALKAAKGTNIFLETEWQDHHLLCIPKNPRR